MGKFNNEDVVREIKRRLSIRDLVEGYTSIVKKGRNYVALCPFHDDSNPSMHIDEEKNLFHCFSCGAGGDIFGFYMRYNNLAFPEALTELANKANVPLEEPSSVKKVSNKPLISRNSRLYKVNLAASKYYKKVLSDSPAAAPAREYLSNRNISPQTIEEFDMGYAPDSWESLSGFLNKKKIPLELAEQVGLIVKRPNSEGYYDRFRNRIIFPIIDTENKVIGFGGRVLDPKDEPKYINSSESDIYKKRRNFYGLNKSRDYIRKERQAVIVEGYTDFLSLYSKGITNVLATLGTALTSEHVSILKRYTDSMVLVFDGDESGTKAAVRSLDIFLAHGLLPSVVLLPEGEDPDTFVSSRGVDEFKSLVEAAPNLLDFVIEKITEGYKQGQTPLTRSVKEVTGILSGIKDPLTKMGYIRKTAEKFGLRENEILSMVRPSKGHGNTPSSKPSQSGNNETLLLKLLLNFPALSESLINEPWREVVETSEIKDILEEMIENDTQDVSALLVRFNDSKAHGIISEALMLSVGIDDQETARKMLVSSMDKLRAKKTQNRLKSLRLKIESAIKEKNTVDEKKLLEEYRDLMKLK